MKKIITLGCLIIGLITNAQSGKNIWSPVYEKEILITGKRDIIPEKYKTFHLDINKLKEFLSSVPLDKNIITNNSTAIISLPMPDGSIQNFKVVESSVMEEPLQQNHPDIRTYNVQGIDDMYASGKLDLTEYGFHGMIRSPNGDVFIDPYCKWNVNDYITYYTSDFSKPESDRMIEIGVLEEIEHHNSQIAAPTAVCAGSNLRTYRLAVACTGEYARAACGTGTNTPTNAQILAKVVTTINRVDGVYETEVAVKLVLVNTTTLVLYGDPSTDPFTGNSNGSTLIGESQTVINANVTSANYDIGHTFSTGGGGLAGLGVVCGSSKARGITGSPNPVGDPYDIDYVAHEIGHQFRGNHTFNGSTGSCAGGNRNASTAVEPGSGVTIMAYAGICSPQDLAPNSIAYFHAISYDEITNFITTGNGNSCPVNTTTGNNPPTVSASINYTVPKSTPFQLTGSATDPDNNPLTYQWEEIDLGVTAGSWNNGAKPFFRSYAPVASPTRLFPKLSVVQAGTYTTSAGEFLPNSAQTLKFRLNVRDNLMGGGGVCSATTQITVDATTGPFAVTSQSVTGIIYPSASTQLISWNVNGTDQTPINCSNVNIYVSIDNGTTFSLVLANTPNDGSENVVMPTVATDKPLCRVKVESIGNIFFDINKKFFKITAATGLNQYSNSNNFNIQLYPNPFTSSVKIDINTTTLNENKTVMNVYDILGNMVRTENIKLTENFSKIYDFSNLANGSYIVEVTDGKQKSVARLIKM
ncbi:MAG: zinc-dependent metalloprotease [Bacteroidia bacterium]|nr:zinc-dependent metalloprotease [Bacteroidia bacterium]